jgi:hypothetical protein
MITFIRFEILSIEIFANIFRKDYQSNQYQSFHIIDIEHLEKKTIRHENENENENQIDCRFSNEIVEKLKISWK